MRLSLAAPRFTGRSPLMMPRPMRRLLVLVGCVAFSPSAWATVIQPIDFDISAKGEKVGKVKMQVSSFGLGMGLVGLQSLVGEFGVTKQKPGGGTMTLDELETFLGQDHLNWFQKVVKDTGVRGSSSTRVHGSAAYQAAINAREEVLKVAAQVMATAPEQLVLYQGGVIHRRAERRMSLADIVRANGKPIRAEGHYANMADGPESSLVAQVAEVEVDEETGEVTVRRLTTAHNTGTILNPLTHQGQIDGAVLMGVGYGVMEELASDDGGRVITPNLGDYKIPNIKDIPELKTAIVQSNVGSGPYNSMSIGETALIPTAAAIANAVADAVGVRITSLPITAEKVLNALKAR